MYFNLQYASVTVEQKLHWTFKLYDKVISLSVFAPFHFRFKNDLQDGSGEIDPEEMEEIFTYVLHVLHFHICFACFAFSRMFCIFTYVLLFLNSITEECLISTSPRNPFIPNPIQSAFSTTVLHSTMTGYFQETL